MHAADVQLLDPETHAGLGLKGNLTFAFAAGYNLVPLTVTEFSAASVWYPIVFVNEEQPRPVVVTGVPPGDNLFVDADGGWRYGAYIPAAIRRYPFTLQFDPQSDTPQLCVQQPGRVLEPSGRALFAEGQPAPLVKDALEFCCNLMAEEAKTAQFSAELQRRGMLVKRKLTVSAPGRPEKTLEFHSVHESGFGEIDDATFCEWRRRGWAAATYAHLASTLNWQKIGDLANRTQPAAAPAPLRRAS